MSVQELSHLHRRYVDLSQRFRAAWVYHQFLHSLARVNGDESTPSPFTGRFQDLYAQLKECSQSLTPAEAASLKGRFDDIGAEVAELIGALLAEDSKVEPQTLRHFFQKFRNYDEKILAQLVRFYLFACAEPDWHADRRDKVDFLISRLGEEMRRTDRGPGAGTQQMNEILASLWGLTGEPEPSLDRVEGLCRALDEIRGEANRADNLDDLTSTEALRNYREFKHSLGLTFFHPRVLDAVLETNFAFRDTVRRLYRQEERRIAADYQRIFDLEREVPVDVQLDQELSIFRQQVERFERQLQQDEMRLDDLTELRRRARSLIPRLAPAEQPGGEEGGTRDDDVSTAEVTARAVMEAMDDADRAAQGGGGPPPEIAEAYAHLVQALGDTTLGSPPRSIVLTPDIYPYHLEAREVVAFRRVHEGLGDEQVEEERFLLVGAALRVALQEQAEALREVLDGTGDGGGHRRRAHALVALGDDFLRRYENRQQRALLADRADDARQLALLRTRLMKDYAELWLLVHDELRRVDPS